MTPRRKIIRLIETLEDEELEILISYLGHDVKITRFSRALIRAGAKRKIEVMEDDEINSVLKKYEAA